MTPRIDVQYQTLTLPPPYSYAYTLWAELAAQSVAITLDWRYTDRDELSEEEIWEEGFTADDDFRWQGTLPAVWKPVLNRLLDQTTWLPATSSVAEADWLMVTFTDAVGKATAGVPSDAKRWNYQLQELVQAVYEAARRERPLRIRYLDRSQADYAVETVIKVSFLHLRFTVTTQRNTQPCTQKLPWDEVPPLLETLYLPDYHPEQSTTAYPRQRGRYIDPGDGRWYQVGTAVSNPGKSNVLQRLQQMITNLTLSDRPPS